MILPNSAKEVLGSVFYSVGKTPDAIDDLMSILKILDFRWDAKNQVLIDESTEKPLPREKLKHVSQWKCVPIKNLSNFDLDCMEKVLNTRIMKELPTERVGILFESIGWQIKKHGDTYRLHFIGGTDYWETDNYWKTDWKEPWNDEIQPLNNDTLKMVKLEYPNLPNWDPDNEIPKEWT